MKKICISLSILLCAFFLCSSINVNASDAQTLSELRSELQALKNKKAANESKKNQTKGEINSAKNNIFNTQNEIQVGRDQISSAKEEVAQLTVEIDQMKESIKNLMNSYEVASGENIYLDYIFNASSYADLVYRYSLVGQIIKYNDDKVDKYNSKIEYNNELQVELTAKEVELNKKISSLENNIDSLGNKLSEYTDIVMDAQDEIDSTAELISYYEGIGCGENENLDSCAQVRGDTKFRKPLTKGTITSYFGYRIDPIKKVKKFHSGVDIGGNREGTNVYATANGKVGKIIRKASCGGNQVYIYHTIGGKKYTSMYMHLLSIKVSLGEAVTSNTVIGTVGGGSGTSSWEGCSTGAHLHFTIATGWYGQDYVSYSTFLSKTLNPKDILNLPNKYTYWYSR